MGKKFFFPPISFPQRVVFPSLHFNYFLLLGFLGPLYFKFFSFKGGGGGLILFFHFLYIFDWGKLVYSVYFLLAH